MTERQAYIAFNLTEKIGAVTLSKLAASAGSVAAAWDLYPKKVSRTGGEVDWAGEERLAEKYGVRIVTPADADYPRRLTDEPGHPLALYVRGDLAALAKPAIAIIGTRRATAYGQEQASRLAYDLAQAGWSVVSGLARGIDAAAHRGALDAGGVTTGILGSGLDRFYPEENRELARAMARSGGAVVSEFPFGRPADTTTFPIRNHVVAALAHGVVAVEAPVQSGTLITTGIAADLGRPVMAIPGRVDSRMSAGCLRLIRDGATLVRNADDVLEAVGGPLSAKRADEASAPSRDPDAPAYSPEEALVMLHVEDDGSTLDELVKASGLSVAKVQALAMALRIKGFVRFLPGNRIAPSRPLRQPSV